MPPKKLDFTAETKALLHDPTAQTVFMVMHQTCPRADWSKDVPKLGDNSLAQWWVQKFAALSDMRDDKAKNAIANEGARAARDNIRKYLGQMSSQFGRGDATWKDTAIQMSAEFNKLIQNIGDDMPSPDKDVTTSWASFQSASASLLLRVSAYAGLSDPSVGPRSEATLKLAEERQRLKEFVGEPPADLKIKNDEQAATYLSEGIRTNQSDLSPGAQITLKVIKTLVDEKPAAAPGRGAPAGGPPAPSNPATPKDPTAPDPRLEYLESLVNEVKECRNELVSQAGQNPPKFDKDYAMRAIMIAEAMTPECKGTAGINLQDKKRPAFTPDQLRRLGGCVNKDFEDRLSDEAKEVKGDRDIL